MNENPIWLLDIDGVLNAVRPAGGEYVRTGTGYSSVCYRPALMQRIAHLHAGGTVDIRWLTTWMERSLSFAEAVGLAVGLPVVGQEEFRRGGDWWKATAARGVAEAYPDRLIVWTDDDLDYSLDCGELDWVIGYRMLRLSPDPRVGLTDDQIRMIKDAVEAEHNSRASI